MITAIITLTAFFTSFISGVFGMAGGVILISVMAQYYPPMILIPLHGVIQLISNVTRTAISIKSVPWKLMIPFGLASPVGAWAASHIVINMSKGTFQMILGISILLMTWMPQIKKAPRIPGKFYILGFITTFTSLFTGATGPFVMPFLMKEGLNKEEIIVAQSTCQIFAHTFKILAYMTMGFQIEKYMPLLTTTSIVAIAGTVLSKMFLKKIPDKNFEVYMKIILTLLAGRMILTIL